MMNQDILLDVISRLNEVAISNFISKTTVISKTDFLLSFSFYKEEQLFISLNHINPFIAFIKKKEDIVTENNNLNEQLKQRVRNTYIEEISALNDDRIVRFSLSYSNDYNEKHRYQLILELIPHHPNLLICDEDKKILFATHYTDLTFERAIIKNGEYTLPMKHQTNYKATNKEEFINSVNNYLEDALNKKKLNQYSALIQYLEKEIKKCSRKEKILEEEIRENSNYSLYKERGDYILTYAYDSNELNNYLQESHIECDNSLSPIDNANKQYKLYRKKKATTIHDEEEIIKNRKRYEQLISDLETVKSLDIYQINALQSRYPKLIKKQKMVIAPKYPFLTVINGVKYAFGRNAMQNDYLTFRLASKEHYFFHIKGFSGAHVILMKDNPDEKEIATASQIAVYVSKKDIGEVDYAKVSTIKKGHAAGEVLLGNHSSYVVKNIEEEIKISVKKASRLL